MEEKIYIIANWKARKTLSEIKLWFNHISREKIFKNLPPQIKIIIAPPYPFLMITQSLIKKHNLSFALASQDISAYPAGAYTGEVPAEIILNLVDYAIIGHTERRKILQENTNILKKKLLQAKKNNLKTIYCLLNTNDSLKKQADILAYEPPESIGTGKNTSLSKILEFKEKAEIKKTFLYGGSVNLQNIDHYLTDNRSSSILLDKSLDGFLLGTVSLYPIDFTALIKKLIK